MSDGPPTMKTAQAWEETVAYVDCPECRETIEIGAGVVWSGVDCEQTCAKCGTTFKVESL